MLLHADKIKEYHRKINSIKSYTFYTENEILDIISFPRNQDDYDRIIDYLYFCKFNGKKHTNITKNLEYNILLTRTLRGREEKESYLHPDYQENESLRFVKEKEM